MTLDSESRDKFCSKSAASTVVKVKENPLPLTELFHKHKKKDNYNKQQNKNKRIFDKFNSFLH